MKKRNLVALLIFCLLVGLLPQAVYAGGGTEIVTTYEELKEALETATEDTTIYIEAESDFGWPQEPAELTVSRQRTVLLNQDWEIPSGVTVKFESGIASSPYNDSPAKLIVAGTVSEKDSRALQCDVEILDGGSVSCESSNGVYIPADCTWTVQKGGLIESRIQLDGTLTGNGAVISQPVMVSANNYMEYEEGASVNAVLSGQLFLTDQLSIETRSSYVRHTPAELTIPEGSMIVIEEGVFVSVAQDGDDARLVLNGELEMSADASAMITGTIETGDAAVLQMMPSSRIYTPVNAEKVEIGKIVGSGTVNAFANKNDDGSYTDYPTLFRILSYLVDNRSSCADLVEESITIRCNWLCDHEWSEETLKEADCVTDGLSRRTCSICQMTETNVIPALGHDLICSIGTDGASFDAECRREGCGYSSAVTLSVREGAVYTGEEILGISLLPAADWSGELPLVTYSDNVNAGEATAVITMGSETITRTFTIEKAPVHTLSLGNLSQYKGSVSDVTWSIDPEDDTAEVSVEYQITTPESPCGHIHTEECGENGEECTHQHDEDCGYAEAATVWTTTLPTETGSYPVRARLIASDNLVLAEADDYTTGTLVISKQTLKFTDVKDTSFYREAVDWAVENEVTTGVTPTEFKPSRSCTRGEIVTFLYRAMNGEVSEDAECVFTDVNESAFYYDAVLWAVENNITTGTTSTTFAPGRNCTRGEIVTFLCRAMRAEASENAECTFTDVSPDAFYYNYMLWAVENGITTGTTETTFAPGKACSRGECVTFLYRAVTENR